MFYQQNKEALTKIEETSHGLPTPTHSHRLAAPQTGPAPCLWRRGWCPSGATRSFAPWWRPARRRPRRAERRWGGRRVEVGWFFGSRSKKLLGARASLLVTKGIATRSKDATSRSWPYYCLCVCVCRFGVFVRLGSARARHSSRLCELEDRSRRRRNRGAERMTIRRSFLGSPTGHSS